MAAGTTTPFRTLPDGRPPDVRQPRPGCRRGGRQVLLAMQPNGWPSALAELTFRTDHVVRLRVGNRRQADLAAIDVIHVHSVRCGRPGIDLDGGTCDAVAHEDGARDHRR